MVDFVQLQHIMKEQLDQDKTVRAIEAHGSTLNDAVAQAATLLNLSIRRIEYEVTERGFSGFMGAGKKDWKIRAYERLTVLKSTAHADSQDGGFDFDAPVSEDKDGDVFVQLIYEGAFLKIIPPVGNGRRVDESQAMEALHARQVNDIDRAMVDSAVKDAAGEYVRVGDFEHHSANSATMVVDITDQEMKALLFVNPPGFGGCDIPLQTYLSFLKSNRVVHGIDEDFLLHFADRPVYKERVVVAEGRPPVNGRDAYIQYNFETDQSKVRIREGVNGRVDFKELNIIQNVVESQLLAKKIPLEMGVPGRTVTGNPIPARDGRDIVLPLGKNVRMGEDGSTIIAEMNGQVVEVGGKINVEPVYTVPGDVNLKTGNIIFLGTVIINGNVEDGFSVKAAGNIEVNGTVEKAELDAEGDIIVHQGITGKGTGTVRAGKSVWARFIENTIVEAGTMVVAADGIINSKVDAYKRIICYGKRASIVGGRLRAGEEINAKVLGSPTSGTETICEVGVDPKTKELLVQLGISKGVMEKQLEEIKLNIQTLINIKKQRKSLPEEKEAYLKELIGKRQEMIADLKKIVEQMEQAQDFLNNLKIRGRVSASARVYPGVKIIIRDAHENVKNEYRDVTFLLEDGLVRVSKYEESEEDVTRGPDGYTTH
jgi:uncharacterized protein (DUF342 family)